MSALLDFLSILNLPHSGSKLTTLWLSQEGTSNYFKGLMLILCYLIVGASFFVHVDIPDAHPGAWRFTKSFGEGSDSLMATLFKGDYGPLARPHREEPDNIFAAFWPLYYMCQCTKCSLMDFVDNSIFNVLFKPTLWNWLKTFKLLVKCGVRLYFLPTWSGGHISYQDR